MNFQGGLAIINKIIYFILINCIFSAEPINNHDNSDTRSDFLEDRAKGYLLNGMAKTAIANNGNFISWNQHPAGFWGEYGYLPHLGFISGIPGHAYSSDWSWEEEWNGLWSSSHAYDSWVDGISDPENEAGNFSTIVYNTIDDRGDIAMERNSIDNIVPDGDPQWVLDHENHKVFIYINDGSDPNISSARIGLAYPWSIRPRFVDRTDEYDIYEYGNDEEAWTEDDEYVYYGANTNESWFIRDAPFGSPNIKTDWQGTKDSRYNSHNLDVTAGEIFGNTPWADSYDPGKVLAHSSYMSTWPNDGEPYWPGIWGEMNDGDNWEQVPGQFISDTDVYMEFDDRLSSIANDISYSCSDATFSNQYECEYSGETWFLEGEYVSTGYPMGLKVIATGHSYGVSIAEDIIFFTMKVRNESGDFCAFEKDSNGDQIPILDDYGEQICGDAMEMPDGSRLNGGNGFNYNKVNVGFYMDADVLTTDINGTPSGTMHTPSDDFMRYIDCKVSPDLYPDGCPVVNNDTLRISMAVIGDYDGASNTGFLGYSMGDGTTKGPDFGMVAVQLLDTPYASDTLDLDQDGYTDIYPGEKLRMTDWHWFDWFSRPGVFSGGQSSDTPALNKELIQYQVMAGDTTNLTDAEKTRYFHTANPQTDLDSELNPHFDSLDGLEETSYFQNDQDGLDCVLEMSSGPFDLEVGEQVPMSFVVLFGQDMDDLKYNAEMAQILYNNHYRMFSVPTTPSLFADAGENLIYLSWDDLAESSIDNETGLQDFEGYRLYRSTDGGETWGNEEDMIFDSTDVHVGWQPYAQFDLDNDISGPDPAAPWFNLGDNTGLQHSFIDLNVYSYQEYCYALTAYDAGVPPGYEASWGIDFENGFPSIESNSMIHMVCLYPDPEDTPSVETLFEASEANIGWGQITYLPHNVDVENDGLFKFEIQAEIDTNTFLNSATLNPKLFVYEVDENGYQISEYLVQDFPIYSLYEEGGDYEWLDILGMYIKIENLQSNLENNPFWLVELEEVIFSDTLLSDIIDVKMRYKNPSSDFPLQPYFDYQIEFSSSIMDTAVYGIGRKCDQYEGYPENSHTMLPFKITNLTLNNQADLSHYDFGIYDGQIIFGEVFVGEGCVPVCTQGEETCVEGQCLESLGYKNCHWERHEGLRLEEILPDGNAEYIYRLKIGFNLEEYYNHVGADPSLTDTWVEGETYLSGEIVYHEGMLWEATENIAINNPPDEWFDNNNDNINDNPWQMLYPWEDGDSAIISIRKKLHDGDSWLVDMSKIGDCSANLGDVNNDDYVNILDVVRIVNVIVGNDEFDTNQNCTADFNQDGTINILDVVELVNMIMGYDDALLSRSHSPKHLNISLSENSIRVPADGAFGGLQISTEGQYSITEMQISEGLELYKGPTGIVIINLTGRTQKSDIIISYRGELKIIDHLASDLFGKELLTKMVGVPTMYTLNHAYPNPFNPVTTIQYGVPMESQIKLAIYDLLGREVTILYSDIQISGYHKIIWDASQYASGMYFVQLISEDFVQTQKLMLVK